MSRHDLVCAHCGGRIAEARCAMCRIALAEQQEARWRQLMTQVVLVVLAAVAIFVLAGRSLAPA
jgi:hypothetical protein